MNPSSRRKFLARVSLALLPASIARAYEGACTDAPQRIDSLGGPGGYADDMSTALSAAALDDTRKSGLSAVNVTVSGVGSYARNYDETIRNIAYWSAQIAAHPDRLMPVRTGADLDTARCAGKLGLIYGFQDATPLGEDIDRVDTFRDLGVRIFQLTYNRRNLVGDGCLESGNAGLSEFGRKLVAKLNERKLLVDLSHAGERTTLEAIDASKSPIAISHTGCAALASLPRNKTDNELRKLADKGGYVGIYLMPFLRSKGQPTAADLIAHLEHAIDVCGEDHVGIGSDGAISPIAVTPEFKKKFANEVNERRKRGISAPGEDPNVYTFLPDLNRADRFARIAELLVVRGHSAARIDKVLGANFARTLKEVWG
ncbi:MAG: peptidase M19 [Gammaproteobacteria bacterium]|nr:MAG: peptidase M19 [Gammaproteobacteria bacterium]